MKVPANLENDYGFITKEYSSHGYEVFWKNPKQSYEGSYSIFYFLFIIVNIKFKRNQLNNRAPNKRKKKV